MINIFNQGLIQVVADTKIFSLIAMNIWFGFYAVYICFLFQAAVSPGTI